MSGRSARSLDPRTLSAEGAVAALAEGVDLLASGRLERARDRFEAAARTFDDLGDTRRGALALLGLGRALLGLEDATCREVLEHAGTYFEDLDDASNVHQIDKLLRLAEASIAPSPRSFHSSSASLRAAPRHEPS